MARIARRALRIKDVPLFSLGKPWQSAVDSVGTLGLRLFEPRYVELAKRVLPPKGEGKFGYAESYPPKVGSAGVLAQVEGFRWERGGAVAAPDDTVLLSARSARRFRILRVRPEEITVGKPPLFFAHVQLLEDRDVVRGRVMEALGYWQGRVDGLRPGTALVARQGAPVFESENSRRVVSQIPAGVIVIAAGPPVTVDGYLMVPIAPSGAVELTLFRERTPGEDTMTLPSEQDVKSVLLNFGASLQPVGSERAYVRRKRRRRSRS